MAEQVCENCFAPNIGGGPCSICSHTPSEHRPAFALPVGTLLNGNFLVGRLLGEPGGFGIAYLCKDIALDTTVAIKELFPQDAVHREESGTLLTPFDHRQHEFRIQYDAFLSEARTLAKIKHPAVVNIRHYFSENNTAYIVMDYYPGRPLAQIVKEKGRLPYEITLDLLWPVFSGLREVHSRGILHRDIKPENVFITDEGRAVLLDFGNARPCKTSSTSGFIGVSAHFTPPEQYGSAEKYMGPWTDVYALCALLYYCLTGTRPTDSRQRQADPETLRPLTDFGAGIPDILVAVVHQGMIIQCDQRFQSIEELQVALRALRPQTGAFVWTEALAEGRFGHEMRSIASAVRAGKGVPIRFSLAASTLQWFWLLGHRMLRLGALSGIAAIVALGLLAWDTMLWPFTLLLFLVNGAACGLLGMTALYHHVEKWAKALPVRTPTEIAAATSALRSLGRLDIRLVARGIAVPLVFCVALFVRTNIDDGIKDQVTLALQMEQLRYRIQGYFNQFGGPPDSLESIGFEFVPNTEIRALRLFGTSVEVSFEIEAVRGKKVMLALQSVLSGGIGWKCKNIDVPARYLPTFCEP